MRRRRVVEETKTTVESYVNHNYSNAGNDSRERPQARRGLGRLSGNGKFDLACKFTSRFRMLQQGER
jgi:hypothetical protein